MMRALVVLLLLANLAFFAWTRGWLGPMLEPPQHGERNPERLGAQVRPESISLLSPKAASAAITAARAASMADGEGEQCMQIGPFASAADQAAAEALLAQANIAAEDWVRVEQSKPAVWGVVIGPLAGADAQKARAEELRRQNIVGEPISQPKELAPTLLLARYSSREAAEGAMPGWNERGVRGARVAALSEEKSESWLRFERSKAATREQLRGMRFAPETVGLRACR